MLRQILSQEGLLASILSFVTCVVIFVIIIVILVSIIKIFDYLHASIIKKWKQRLKNEILYDINWEAIPANREAIFEICLVVRFIGSKIESILTGHISRYHEKLNTENFLPVKRSVLRKTVLERYEVFVTGNKQFKVKFLLYFKNGKLLRMLPIEIEHDGTSRVINSKEANFSDKTSK